MVDDARSGTGFKPRRAEGNAGKQDEEEERRRRAEEQAAAVDEEEHLSFGALAELDLFDE
jgi:hypothetical protein